MNTFVNTESGSYFLIFSSTATEEENDRLHARAASPPDYGHLLRQKHGGSLLKYGRPIACTAKWNQLPILRVCLSNTGQPPTAGKVQCNINVINQRLSEIFDLLNSTGHVMHQHFNIQQIVRSAHTVFMCFVFI